MLYKESFISEDELFHITDGGHYYVNPYYGCSEACPYCYWTAIPGWEGQITVRTNVVEVLDHAMATWNTKRRVCIGSFCNPYESIEQKYRLTRGLLEVVKKRGIYFALMTSSDNILDDAALVASMSKQAIIVFELSRIKRLVDFQQTGIHPVLDAANRLAEMGVVVMATLSPYLKGITDVDAILNSLNPQIPLYLGDIDFKTNPTTASRLLSAISIHKKECLSYCQWLLEGDNAINEFKELMYKYRDNPRVRTFPLDIPYEDCARRV